MRAILIAAALGMMPMLCYAAGGADPTPSLDRGYHDAYNLDFAGAQKEFGGWEAVHPKDAVGPASEAALLLFSELDRLGVLQTQLFQDDKAFSSRKKLEADPAVKARFDAALARAEQEANASLARDPKDVNALFAMALVNGLRSDYLALIEKRNLASLSDMRQGEEWGQKLLAQSPQFYDAYLATGISKYIVGSMAAPMRWLVKLGGYSGNKDEGMRELTLAAAHGHYLGPFARVLLAVAYLRQDDRAQALTLLEGLQQEFPQNPLYAHEVARLSAR